MPRKKQAAKRKPAPRTDSPPVSEESAAESLFRATYGRAMTETERRSTISKRKPVSLERWMKGK